MKNTKVLKEIKEKYSDYTIQRYARQCYDYSAAKLDDLFLDCFKQELINSGYQKDSNQILSFSDSLQGFSDCSRVMSKIIKNKHVRLVGFEF